MNNELTEIARSSIAVAIDSADSGIASLAHGVADSLGGIATTYKPFTFDNDEVSNRPAARQRAVCTP